jgi:hypothetical protein
VHLVRCGQMVQHSYCDNYGRKPAKPHVLSRNRNRNIVSKRTSQLRTLRGSPITRTGTIISKAAAHNDVRQVLNVSPQQFSKANEDRSGRHLI